MATVIHGHNGREVYSRVLQHIIKHGEARTPRQRLTLDLGFTVIELEEPYDALPLACGRDLNLNIAAAEAVQLVGGFSRPDLLTKAAPGKFEPFMNGDGFHGAYGSRVRNQVMWAVEKFRTDPFTRRAVVTLWHSELDNIENMNDYPCTVALQFQIENERLCMNTVMRSNDAWLGLPYDMFQFTQLQLSVATALHMTPGWYRHTAMSLHLYSEHIHRAEAVYPPTVPGSRDRPHGFGLPGSNFYGIMQRARRCAAGIVNERETTSEEWYRKRFASYMGRDVDADGADDRTTVPLQS